MADTETGPLQIALPPLLLLDLGLFVGRNVKQKMFTHVLNANPRLLQ